MREPIVPKQAGKRTLLFGGFVINRGAVPEFAWSSLRG